MKPTPEQVAAISEVISQLEIYQGEKIAPHEPHPLRLAVIELEKFCFDKGPNYGGQRYSLYNPARNHWFNLLRASRGWPLIPDDKIIITAKQYRDVLQAELKKWLINFPEGPKSEKTD